MAPINTTSTGASSAAADDEDGGDALLARPVPVLVVYGNEDNFTKAGSLELHHHLANGTATSSNSDRPASTTDTIEGTETAEIAGIGGAAEALAPRGSSSVVQLLALPGGHLPHVTRPRDFAAAALRFFRSAEAATNPHQAEQTPLRSDEGRHGDDGDGEGSTAAATLDRERSAEAEAGSIARLFSSWGKATTR